MPDRQATASPIRAPGWNIWRGWPWPPRLSSDRAPSDPTRRSPDRRRGCRMMRVTTSAGAAASEPSAFHGGEMLAHAIDFGDRRTALQQRTRYPLFVFERDAGCRHREQRRAAAGDQTQHHVVFGQSAHERQHALSGSLTFFIGHGMAGLDDLDRRTQRAVAVARNDQARQRSRPEVFHRLRHRRGGLTRAG